ncbi:MAG: SMC-Scp complex subunit ScpB [bacterium]|nr:SMC-Scp complex subunit ScpB [bacterium]
MTAGGIKPIVEVLLFSAQEPLRPSEIRRILEGEGQVTERMIRGAVEELREEYRAGGRSFTIAEVAGGFRLETLPDYGGWIRKLRAAPPRRRLSAPSLETLAIIAYRQPITRAEIEAIRGVNIDGVIENLLDRDLIETKGRKQAIGKPHLYGTSRKFLEHFGLARIEDLPQIDELRRAAGITAPAAAPPAEEGAGKPLV